MRNLIKFQSFNKNEEEVKGLYENEEPVCEAVSVFDNVEMMQEAVGELLSSGFNRAELSLLAGEHAIEE